MMSAAPAEAPGVNDGTETSDGRIEAMDGGRGAGAAGGVRPRAGAGERAARGEEIGRSPAPNVFELVQRLRPGWMQERAGSGGRGYPAVFVGPQAYGGIDRLREIDTSNVIEVRFMNAAEASSRFGRGVPYGVIQVILDIGG
jgi:hypothetical protein